MPKLSKERRGLHIVDPSPQARHITLCELYSLPAGDDAVFWTSRDRATCPQCVALALVGAEIYDAAQAEV